MNRQLSWVLCALLWLLPAGCGSRDTAQQSPAPSGTSREAPPATGTASAPPETVVASPETPPGAAATPPADDTTPTPEADSGTPGTEAPREEPATPQETPPPSNERPEAGEAAPPEAPAATEAHPESNVVDPGGVIGVAATKTGLTRIGPEKCKLCHKAQYESWSAAAHARRTPPLDCEGCHGPGSEYKTLSVMKDPKAARAAGLVIPGREFCATCHRSGWSDDMLTRAHAHKPAAGAN